MSHRQFVVPDEDTILDTLGVTSEPEGDEPGRRGPVSPLSKL